MPCCVDICPVSCTYQFKRMRTLPDQASSSASSGSSFCLNSQAE